MDRFELARNITEVVVTSVDPIEELMYLKSVIKILWDMKATEKEITDFRKTLTGIYEE
jgi:hypothetical protein